jgi:hypothetical protein
MRDKILAELKKKYPGLPTKLLEQIATKLAKTVTEESAIEGAISELNNSPLSLTDFAAQLQAEADRRVTEARNKWNLEHPSEIEEETETETEIETKPKPGKKKKSDPVLEVLNEMRAEIKALKDEKNQTTLAEKLNATLKDKLKDKKPIPALFVSKYKVDKAEDVDTVADTIINEYTALQQEMNNGAIKGSGGAPQGGSSGTGANETDQAIKKFFAKNKPAASVNGVTK